MDIYSNLVLNNKEVTRDEVERVCKLVNIYSFIQSLPNGYKTMLNNSGDDFSVGQKQRIAIARTLISKSKIIVFDESTTALDGKSKNAILKVMDNLRRDHIVIIVDHRMTDIKDADSIIFIKDGEMKMYGRHDDLIHKCKGYKDLFEIEKSLLKKDMATKERKKYEKIK